MAKAAVLKKPAAAPAKPVALAKGKPAAAKPVAAKPAAAPKPAKEIKPYENGSIVVFKGYAPTIDPATGKEVPLDTSDKLFTPEQELAVVGERQDEGRTLVSCVAKEDYFKYLDDADNTPGEELMPVELKRTNKQVEEPYALVVVGNMEAILSENEDPLEVARSLFNRAEESFFYFGGVLSKLFKETDDDGLPLYASYTDADGKPYGKDGFDAFLLDNFGEKFGERKARYHMSIYETFSALPNAEEAIRELTRVGWWKAQLMANYVTADNAMELIETAATQNEKQFQETLKTQYTNEGSARSQAAVARATVKKITFGPYKLFEDQADGVSMIMTAAAKQTGLQDPNALFEHIVTEWAGDHLGEVAARAKAKVAQSTAKLVKSGAKLPADHPAAQAAAAPAAAPAAKPVAKPVKKVTA